MVHYFRHLFAYHFAMGINQQAMARSEKMERSCPVRKTPFSHGKTTNLDLPVNFLDPRSRLPLTRQRVLHDKSTVLGLVSRSLSDIGRGPRYTLLLKELEGGSGEIEIRVSSEQYAKLQVKTPQPGAAQLSSRPGC
jgi:hypothetical protein